MVDTEVRANKKIVQRRYLNGPVDVSDMEVVMSDTLKLELPPGSTAVIVKNLYISIDPYCLHLMARKDSSASTTAPLSTRYWRNRPTAQVVGLLMALSQEGDSERTLDSENDNPMSGTDPAEDDSMDWDLLN